jgi:molybdopterin synthase catalytic subunit
MMSLSNHGRFCYEKIMIQITDQPIAPEAVISHAKSPDSGCVATYVGLIRDNSRGKSVFSVEYSDPDGKASERLQAIVKEIKRKYPVNTVVIFHRVGQLKVGDINLVVAVGAAHRGEGIAAVSYAVDVFKERLPTTKKETYTDGTVWEGH